MKGKYKIGRKLGQGAFGEAFTCWDKLKSDRDIQLVMKIINLASGSRAASSDIQEAMREAEILRQLNHKVGSDFESKCLNSFSRTLFNITIRSSKRTPFVSSPNFAKVATWIILSEAEVTQNCQPIRSSNGQDNSQKP